MKNQAVIDGITVGGQPSEAELTGGRFGTVINVRGATEPGNITGDVLAGTDVAYTAVPWTIETVDRADIERIRDAVTAARGDVLIHCMGGTRAALAAAIVSAEKDGSGAAGALRKAEDAGFLIMQTPYAAFIEAYFAASPATEARTHT